MLIATGPLLFPLSSTSADELRHTARRLNDWLDNNKEGVTPSDLAYTLARRRGHRTVRTAVIAENLDALSAGLREIADGETPYVPAAGRGDRGPVWIFSGQGSQWAAMGAELLATEPVFAATVAQAEPLIARESGFSVAEALSAPETVTGIDRVQPTLFIFQVALATTMRSAQPIALDDLDRTLTVLEEKLFATLQASATEHELVYLKAQADRELAPYRSKMSTVQLRQVQTQFLHKRLLELRSLPRLSLFYMGHDA